MDKYTYLNYNPDSDLDIRLHLIKDAGFDGVFLMYCDGEVFDDLVNKVKAINLKIETFHLPFGLCNHLWIDDDLGEEYLQEIIRGVKSAGRHSVKTVIMHTMSGKNPPHWNKLGLARIKLILGVCEQENVILALENVRDIKYSDYVLQNIKHPNLKMCFDFGHTQAFAYNIKDIDMNKYKGLITCLHIHDNHGDGDEHFLPFTGTIDYEYIVKQLKTIGYNGNLTSEAHWHNLMPEPKFVVLAYKALQEIEKMFGDNNG